MTCALCNPGVWRYEPTKQQSTPGRVGDSTASFQLEKHFRPPLQTTTTTGSGTSRQKHSGRPSQLQLRNKRTPLHCTQLQLLLLLLWYFEFLDKCLSVVVLRQSVSYRRRNFFKFRRTTRCSYCLLCGLIIAALVFHKI